MSQSINISSIKFTDNAIDARTNLYDKVRWRNESTISQYIPKQADPPNLSMNTTNEIVESYTLNAFNISDFNFEGSFNNLTLEQLRQNYDIPEFKTGKWIAKLVENNGRISLQDVKVQHGSDGGNTHSSPVFETVEFRDIIVTLDVDGEEFKICIDKNTPNYYEVPEWGTYRRVGFHGELDNNTNYQMGIKQRNIYLIKCADSIISLIIDYTFVFMYPADDFEPTSVILANKIFPQIEFRCKKLNIEDHPRLDTAGIYTIFPSQEKNGNKIKVQRLNARIKLVCNNNSKHHVTLDGKYDSSYFKDLRETNNIPPMFERNFKLDPVNYPSSDNHPTERNIVGLYTDSNFGSTTKYGTLDLFRDKPSFPFQVIPETVENYSPLFNYPLSVVMKRSQPAALWSNIFDYGYYNVVKETEFLAVHGIQSDKYNAQTRTFSKSRQPYIYPRDQYTKQIKIAKERRQASYDNIHLHGYFGHYSDNNQPVIHAPICGYCCFHMHWRWSNLNVELAKNKFLRLAGRNYNYIFDDGARYKGWNTNTTNIFSQEPFSEPGMPLIPYEQQLKIAITDPDVEPFDKENNVTPTNNTTLDHNRKAVWYCVEIQNEDFGDNSQHSVLEQGCGYAYDYTKSAKRLAKEPFGLAFIAKLFRQILSENFEISDETFLDYIYKADPLPTTSLEVNELYEIQYRIMRLFNEPLFNSPEGKPYLNQVPAINGDPYLGGTVEDENTQAKLQYIFDQIINQ